MYLHAITSSRFLLFSHYEITLLSIVEKYNLKKDISLIYIPLQNSTDSNFKLEQLHILHWHLLRSCTEINEINSFRGYSRLQIDMYLKTWVLVLPGYNILGVYLLSTFFPHQTVIYFLSL